MSDITRDEQRSPAPAPDRSLSLLHGNLRKMFLYVYQRQKEVRGIQQKRGVFGCGLGRPITPGDKETKDETALNKS